MIMQIGSINLMLLQALKDSSKYGIEIVKYVSEATNGAMDVKQPSLYSGLNRLEKRGLISSYWQNSDIGGRRHYYTITELGLTQLKLHATQIQSIMSGIIPDDEDEEDDLDDLPNTTEDNEEINQTNKLADDIQQNEASEDVEEENDTDITYEDTEEDKTLDTNKIDTQSEQDSTPIDIDSLLNMAETTPMDTPLLESNDTVEESNNLTSNDNNIADDTTQNATSYTEYKPSHNTTNNKSFSQKMRAYVEPKNNYAEYEMKKTTEIVDSPKIATPISSYSQSPTTPTFDEVQSTLTTPPMSQNFRPRETSFINNQETKVEYTKQESSDIDYKNILGELDAELNFSTPQKVIEKEVVADITPTPQENHNNTNQPPKKSAYSQQLANILTSAKNANNISTSTKHTSNIGNQQRLDELNRKYDGRAELKCGITTIPEKNVQDVEVVQKIQSKKAGYSHIAQDSITIKPYVKQDKDAHSDKSYLFINKFNLIRTFIMFVIMCLELGGMYWYFAESGIISAENSTANAIFIASAVLMCLYVGLMLTYNVPSLQKIVLRSKISWKSDFFYRILLTVILVTFVIALNIFLGMPAFNDPAYLVQWLVPSIMILNVTLSGIVGYIMNAFKVQCK